MRKIEAFGRRRAIGAIFQVLKSCGIRTGIAAALFALAAAPCAGHAQMWSRGDGGSITGQVQDATGAPQMGALIQVLAPDSSLIASAVTDLRGRYKLAHVQAGSYQLRATAALFLPAERKHLSLVNGSHTVVNLTLSAIYSAADWLPEHRRAADQSLDDWVWTLRSSANRPILRVLDDNGSQVSVSSSGAERGRSNSAHSEGRLTVTSDDGVFAHGGVHQRLTVSRADLDGSAGILEAEFSGPRTPYPVAPSAEIAAGIQSKEQGMMQTRSVMTYASHPELVSSNTGATGIQAATVRSAGRMKFGDTATVDAGSMLRDINSGGNSVNVLPFVRLAVNPSGHLSMSYAYATSTALQSYDDLDRVDVPMQVAMPVAGRLLTERDRHQQVQLAAHAQNTVIELAFYSDNIENPQIAGVGVLSGDELGAGGAVSDPTTQTFRMLAGGFHSAGYRLMVQQSLTQAITVSGTWESGNALRAGTAFAGATDLPTAMASLHPHETQAAGISVNGRILRTGSRLRASYRWQPENTMTAVNLFGAYGESPYLSVHLRQPIRFGTILPGGLEAVVDVTNLLAQGYQPFLSSDGRVLFFAQAPRALQAGLSFTF